MDPLLIALALCGLLVGATGTWSPCGFSMIETIGPTGHTGGVPTTLAACLAFAPAALLGGVLTFGALGLIGEAVGGGAAGYVFAAVLALAAAVAEARGLRIVPQVRRQLPIGWRTAVPMPVAAAGYGVLLGLGFTTFVLSYGVWALMGVAIAVGDPWAGALIGVAFGIGRAVPIVVLAPIADRPSGERLCEAMAMDRRLYRGARMGDAGALALVAVAAFGAAGAEAAKREVPRGSDPSAAGGALVYQGPNGGVLRNAAGDEVGLPGSDPATGGPWIAVFGDGSIDLLRRDDLTQVSTLPAEAADAVAVAADWLVFRTVDGNRDRLRYAPIGSGGAVGNVRGLARARRPGQLSAPAVDRSAVVYAVSKKGRSKLVRQKLRLGEGKGGKKTLLSSRTALHTAPAVSGKTIAYVQTTRKRQTVRLKGLGGGKGRAVHRARRAPPTLWSTAIAGDRVFVTIVNKGGKSRIVSTGR